MFRLSFLLSCDRFFLSEVCFLDVGGLLLVNKLRAEVLQKELQVRDLAVR